MKQEVRTNGTWSAFFFFFPMAYFGIRGLHLSVSTKESHVSSLFVKEFRKVPLKF